MSQTIQLSAGTGSTQSSVQSPFKGKIVACVITGVFTAAAIGDGLLFEVSRQSSNQSQTNAAQGVLAAASASATAVGNNAFNVVVPFLIGLDVQVLEFIYLNIFPLGGGQNSRLRALLYIQ
jgi:hypothetical protein